MKIIIGICLVLLSTLVGKHYTEKYVYAEKYLVDLSAFNKDLCANLNYKKSSVKEVALKEYASSCFNDTLSSFVSGEELSLPKFLSDEDKSFVADYFSKIGSGNVLAEKEFLSFADGVIADKLNEWSKKANSYGSLGTKLGFAAGLAAFIVII